MTMSIGCCGRPDIQGLAYAADQYPRSTRAGQRARARLALALLERRALAAGDLALAVRARRGLGSLGTTAEETRRQVEGMQSRALAAANRVGREVQTYLGVALSVVQLAQGFASIGGPDADRDRVFAWIGWVLGGPLPFDVAETDIRILKAVFAFMPLMQTALTNPLLLEAVRADTQARTALAVIARTYLPALKESVDAAYAALPAPSSGAPPEPPPAPPPAEQAAMVATAAQRVAAMTPMQRMAFIQQSKALFRARSGDVVAPKTGNPLLVALPAAALVWYFIR
ncbi:MAG: hypothetical protein ACRCSL_04805 [Microbacterium sp.]